MHPQFTPQAVATEEWRPVVGYEGWYEVSSLGRIRRTHRQHGARIGSVFHLSLNSRGYPHVKLRKGARPQMVNTHRLVTAAFLGPCPLNSEVNHKDGDKTNNRLSNLEYVTSSENRLHALRLGLQPSGEAHWAALLTESDVQEIRALAGQQQQRELAERYGIAVGTLRDVIHRRSWRWM